MASNPLCVLIIMLFFTLTNASPLALRPAKEFKVGGDSGWLEPPATNASFYNLWAATKRFHVGDSLVFEYSNDSVLVVDKWGYYHCETSKAIIEFENGNSTVKLDRAGLFYFISGAPSHCKHGQRMIIDVMSPHSALPPGFEGSPSPAHSSGSASASASVPASLAFIVLPLAAFVSYF